MSPLNIQASSLWENVREEPIRGTAALICPLPLLASCLPTPPTVVLRVCGLYSPGAPPTASALLVKFTSSVDLPTLPSNVLGEFQPHLSEI